ncbi:MAG: homocysteine S-methyltransferase family protein [Candidatus Eisenbacteria sp.]|nr:homocysteine S-methyltransferase family protein [Candidatus Eisenbacteria bacterium]
MATGFLKRIEQGPILFDGGMGSLLIAQGLASGEAPEPWNVDRRDVVRSAHRAYYEAGADVVTTNTFGGTRLKLGAKGLSDRVVELNRAGADLAVLVRPEGKFVAGDIGPTGKVTGLPGEVSYEELKEIFAEQAGILAGAGVDLLAVETMYGLEEARAAVSAAGATGLPVTATMTFDRKPRGFFTLMGNQPEGCLAALEEAGASVVGANCTLGPEDMLDLLETIRPLTSLPILVQANAGQPELKAGETVYSVKAADFAGWVGRMLDAGAGLVGGCCGTTPEFIRQMALEIEARRDGRGGH